MPAKGREVLEGAPKTGFDGNNDDDGNDWVMEMAMAVMTLLDLFPVLMLHEAENCNGTFLSRCLKTLRLFNRKMLAVSLLDIILAWKGSWGMHGPNGLSHLPGIWSKSSAHAGEEFEGNLAYLEMWGRFCEFRWSCKCCLPFSCVSGIIITYFLRLLWRVDWVM